MSTWFASITLGILAETDDRICGRAVDRPEWFRRGARGRQQLPRFPAMHTTPVSLLERLREGAEDAAWSRLVQLYTPLLTSALQS